MKPTFRERKEKLKNLEVSNLIHLHDLPYLREIDIDFQNHIGGYMGGGSWAITSTMDSNGDNARIIIRKNVVINHIVIC